MDGRLPVGVGSDHALKRAHTCLPYTLEKFHYRSSDLQVIFPQLLVVLVDVERSRAAELVLLVVAQVQLLEVGALRCLRLARGDVLFKYDECECDIVQYECMIFSFLLVLLILLGI